MCCSCAALSDKRDALQFAAHWDLKTFQGSNFCLQELLSPNEGLEVKKARGTKKTTREGFSFRPTAVLCSIKKKVYVTCSISRDQWGGCGLTSEHKDTSCLICKRKKHVVSPEEEHVWAPKHEPLCVCVSVCVCARELSSILLGCMYSS